MNNAPILIKNPYDSTVLNIEPLLRYIHEQGRSQITKNLKTTYRYIATTPIDVDVHDPVRVAAIVNDLFELEDMFSQLAIETHDKTE